MHCRIVAHPLRVVGFDEADIASARLGESISLIFIDGVRIVVSLDFAQAANDAASAVLASVAVDQERIVMAIEDDPKDFVNQIRIRADVTVLVCGDGELEVPDLVLDDEILIGFGNVLDERDDGGDMQVFDRVVCVRCRKSAPEDYAGFDSSVIERR